MREIVAVVQPHMVSQVVHALHALEHFPGLTLLDCRGQGRGRGEGGAYQVIEEDIDYHRKVMLLIVCADALVPTMVETIRRTAHTGTHGDGVILVRPLAQTVRIRTGEQDDAAV